MAKNNGIALIAIVLVIFQALFTTSDAKVFQRCELAKLLVNKYKYNKTFLSNWLCMIEAESGMNTKKVAPYPPVQGVHYPVYQSFGLFQINNKNYCGNGYVGGKCKVQCDDLLSDDIGKAAACAQIVQDNEGFKAWKGWEQRCKLVKLPSITSCFGKARTIG